jgi:hypothetical protein
LFKPLAATLATPKGQHSNRDRKNNVPEKNRVVNTRLARLQLFSKNFKSNVLCVRKRLFSCFEESALSSMEGGESEAVKLLHSPARQYLPARGSNMAEESKSINALTTARNKLVEERRALAVAMALGYGRRRTDNSQTNDMREAFIGIQNTIEAIDRAIAHEKLIASESPRSFVVPTVETVPLGASRSGNGQ